MKASFVTLHVVVMVVIVSLSLFPHRTSADLVGTSDITLTVTVCHGSDCGGTSGGGSSGGSSAGGGGGGGGGQSSSPSIPTSVAFSGLAYPYSIVALLRDGQVVASQPAGPDARFSISIAGLASGVYTFSLNARDVDGRKSVTSSFTVNLTSGVSTVISGIFLPPTIGVDKIAVKRGEPITIFGQSVPGASVLLSVHSEEEILRTVISDAAGLWKQTINSFELTDGGHSAQSQATKDDESSSASALVQFSVGTKTILATSQSAMLVGDTSGDSRVNLVDFSIMSYWFRRPLTDEIRTKVDLSGDGKVDLVDFSIMAYNWTG